VELTKEEDFTVVLVGEVGGFLGGREKEVVSGGVDEEVVVTIRR